MRTWNHNSRSTMVVALRCDFGKDDSGACAVFTEQGWSASEMTAAKIMDVTARVPDCDGQAADATSAYTQVKMEDAPRLLKNPKSEGPDVWIHFPRHKWPKSWSSREDPVVPLERNLYGHPHAGLLWKRQFEESFVGTWMGKSIKLRILICSQKTKVIHISIRERHQNGWKEPEWRPCWRNWWKKRRSEPTSFLGLVYLGCTGRECKPNDAIVEQYNKMFESRTSAGATEKLPGWEKPHAKNNCVVLWHGRTCSKKCVERFCELANKKGRAIKQGIQLLLGRSPTQTGRIRNYWWIVKRLLTYCLEMLVSSNNWSTWHSVVTQQTWRDLSQNGPKFVTDDWHD